MSQLEALRDGGNAILIIIRERTNLVFLSGCFEERSMGPAEARYPGRKSYRLTEHEAYRPTFVRSVALDPIGTGKANWAIA